jgi:ABC-type oligopeptide transport system ATPase subunit
VRTVDGIDFDVLPGESIGLVSASGFGKSTAARSVRRIEPDAAVSVLATSMCAPPAVAA